MMTKAVSYLCAFLLALPLLGVEGAGAEETQGEDPLVLDVTSGQLSLQALIDSGWPVKSFLQDPWLVGEATLEVRLPDNVLVEFEAAGGVISAPGGLVSSVELYTRKVSSVVALSLAEELHEKFGLPPAPLQEWMAQAQNDPRRAKLYSRTNNDVAPRLSVGFRRSFNRAEPWIVAILVTWD